MARFAKLIARVEAQRDVDRILAELPNRVHGNLLPESDLPRDWKLVLLRKVEPIEIMIDGSFRFSRDITQAAIDLGFVDPTR